ncbi:hypothetical protein [Zooshikella ganghwensis]|uniref:Thioredoxin-like fold domain-containing protein n=1 Tax=Zooshikella ganghwensis TaxID=202772 RepID=A0A4P9VPT7_9GAMM|nr:hypothetical protein [Zooshikella ganghwensis]RDH44140.1 hypothetical protein B9G39_12160 [Zooshikella ganghwensis]
MKGSGTPHITMVKKILADGSACRKCNDVQQRLEASGFIDLIDEVIEAHEVDLFSPGMIKAAELGVTQAPFFIVEDPSYGTRIYTVYFKLVQEVLKPHHQQLEEDPRRHIPKL